jgi:hypothetical protein
MVNAKDMTLVVAALIAVAAPAASDHGASFAVR